jgi:hypothetical protein
MTPKEKANEIFNKFCYAIRTEETDSGYFTNVLYAKNCALIAVDEIIYERFYHNGIYEVNKKIKPHIEIEISYRLEATRNYWNEVKHEIEKL